MMSLINRNRVWLLLLLVAVCIGAIALLAHIALEDNAKRQSNLDKLANLYPPFGWDKEAVVDRSYLSPELDFKGKRFTRESLTESTLQDEDGQRLLKAVYRNDTLKLDGFYLLSENDAQTLPTALGLIGLTEKGLEQGDTLELLPGFILGKSSPKEIQRLLPKANYRFRDGSSVFYINKPGIRERISVSFSDKGILQRISVAFVR
jgi:hypothetical protein